MFLHIGEEIIVFLKDILTIMDIERTTTSSNTREFLKGCEEKGMVVTVGEDIPKSFIVTIREGKQTVYLSPISTATLKKRIMKQTEDNGRNILKCQKIKTM